MIKSYLTVSTLALGMTLGVSLLFSSSAAVKASAPQSLNGKSAWAVTMIDGDTIENSYCALVRQYDQGVVLTLGQSTRDEFSFAVDFQNEKLNADKAYKIDLNAGGKQSRNFEIMPTSQQAMVIRLGYDNDFLQAAERSEQLKVTLDGKGYEFALNDFKKGRSDLKKCIAGLTGEGVVKTARNFTAEKIDNALLGDVPAKKTVPQKTVPSVAKKIQSSAIDEVKEVKKEVKIVNVPEAVIAPEPIVLPAPIVKEEAKRESKPIKISRIDSKAIAPPVMKFKEEKEGSGVVIPSKSVVKQPKATLDNAKEAKQKIAKIEAPETVKKVQSQTSRVSLDPVTDREVSSRPESVSAYNKKYGTQPLVSSKAVDVVPAQKKEVKMAHSEERTEPLPLPVVEKKAKPVSPPMKKAPEIAVEMPLEKEEKNQTKNESKLSLAEMQALADEKKFPKPFSKKKERVKKDAPRPPEAKVEDAPIYMPKTQAKKEVQRTSKTEKELDSKRAEKPVAVTPVRPVADQKTIEELSKVREQLAALEKENRELYLEARQARGAIDTAVVETGNEALKEIRAYEKKLEAARADNLALSQELEEMRRLQEDKQVGLLENTPDVQQAVRRYNESQREVKRLGLLLEQQRLSHRQEKTELEEMLFDPAVTEEAQRRKLMNLESKLAQAEKRLAVDAQKINKVNPETEEKMRDLERKLALSKQKEQALKAEEQRVKIEAKKVAAAQEKLNALTQKEELLKMKETRLLSEAQKISNAQETLARAQAKERELKAAEAKIRMEAQKIAEAEIKLEKARRKEQEVKAAEEKIKLETQKLALTEKKLRNQSKKIAVMPHVNPIVPKAPMRVLTPSSVSAPRALVPTARNITSNPSNSSPVSSFGKTGIQTLLQRSGMVGVNLRQQSVGRYLWNVAGLQGKAQVVAPQQTLTQFASSYLAKEKQNCRGDFASLPARVPGGAQGYELACINANGGKSSSVVFAKKEGSLIAITHETSPDNMDAAIDVRDKIASQL